MKITNLFKELVATYRKHGWELRAVLLQPETLADFQAEAAGLLEKVSVKEESVNALWFSRPSSHDRDAWELRLLAETQYALFETFEADETEEQREEVRREMEARLREYVQGPQSHQS